MNPFVGQRVVREGLLELNNLFRSEILPLHEDRFFDQRFDDYLARNPSHVQDINWRQFEGLTAEWFQKSRIRGGARPWEKRWWCGHSVVERGYQQIRPADDHCTM